MENRPPETITVGLTPHRLEFLATTLALMANHRVIILEEPPHPNFDALLRGKVPVETFVEEAEAGFPEYSKEAYRALRRLYAEGRIVCQVEPYLERQLVIRDLLEEGYSPDEIQRLPDLAEAYEREHEATGALLEFYAAMGKPFEVLVEKIKAFARADARRLELRDRLRAREILHLARRLKGPFFVEAGYIHLRLVHYLAKNRGPFRLQVRNLLLETTRAQGLSSFWPSPGDSLTSYYLLGSRHRPLSEDLLAARSLVYIKLILKEELVPNPEDPFPHLKNELLWRLFVGALSFEDCRRLDQIIRFLPTVQAQETARRLFPEVAKRAEEKVSLSFRRLSSAREG